MKQLVIASNNSHKILEIRALLQGIQLLSLHDIGFHDTIPEPYHTFEENAFAKAKAIHKFYGKNVFAEDSGLCVQALNGKPGVDSAHYSGNRNDKDNLNKVLSVLQNVSEREAYYKAVICLIWKNEVYYFEGICEGALISSPKGNNGFGYDPIFMPKGYTETFGELPFEIKNAISHRARAITKMVEFFKEH